VSRFSPSRTSAAERRRDVDVTLGSRFLQETGAALGLLLDSARWLMPQPGTVYTEVMESLFAALGGQQGHDIPLSHLLALLIPEIERSRADVPVVADFQDRWRKILDYDPAAARQTYSAERIGNAVSRMFDSAGASSPPWHSAAYHSPDIMIAKDSGTGRVFAVMEEMHISQASSNSTNFAQCHPNPEQIIAAVDEHAHPYPCHVPLYPRSLDDLSSHWYPTPELQSQRYTYLSFGPRCGARSAPPERTVPVDELAVRSSAEGLVVVRGAGACADGQPGTPLLEVVGEFLAQRATDLFRVMPPLAHTPQISIDQLVVTRETWRPRVTEIPAGKGSDEATAFAGIRQWARRLGLPRHAFWRVP
jgi:hypothetical protein